MFSRGSVGMVEFMKELFSVGYGDSYSVGGWTSAYRAILYSLHL